jgi:hypothetical protein
MGSNGSHVNGSHHRHVNDGSGGARDSVAIPVRDFSDGHSNVMASMSYHPDEAVVFKNLWGPSSLTTRPGSARSTTR